MPNKYIFADESGCMSFTRKPNVSRYFIVCTVAMDDLTAATDLLALRKDLVTKGEQLGDFFHATTDKQSVRDAVFDLLKTKKFSIQAQVMDKPKAQPQVRETSSRFYQYGWYYLFKYGTGRLLDSNSHAIITAATIGERRERAAFRGAIEDVMRQTVKCESWVTDHQPAASDPGLQIADYCAWAFQRKYERGDSRSYELIGDKVTYERDVWERGEKLWY